MQKKHEEEKYEWKYGKYVPEWHPIRVHIYTQTH